METVEWRLYVFLKVFLSKTVFLTVFLRVFLSKNVFLTVFLTVFLSHVGVPKSTFRPFFCTNITKGLRTITKEHGDNC